MRLANRWRGALRIAGLSVIVAWVLVVAGCWAAPAASDGGGAPGADAASAPDEARRYDLTGEVVAVDREGGTMTLEHEAVEGFMGAMTMPFNVRDDWVFGAAAPGARVTATLVVSGDASWLEDVVVRTPAAASAAAEVVVAAPDPGAAVPSIALLDQSGAELSLAAYAGHYYAYTFIYTRCPLPDFCPHMSENFARIHAAVEEDPARYGDLDLLSISIDPQYDTPAVLTEYARRFLGDGAETAFEHWRFATSDTDGLHRLGEFSGLRFAPDGGEFMHSLRTVLVDREGKVIQAFVGNSWQPQQLLDALAAAVGSGR